MVVIFEEYQRIGLVRFEARNAGKKLAEALVSRPKPAHAGNSESSAQFKEYALNLVDQIFQTH
jgi:hypothetical protein